MRLVNKGTLYTFTASHADARNPFKAWIAEVENAKWASVQDVKKRYPRSRFVNDRRIVFKLKGNSYRVDTQISYGNQVVFIKRVGTHAEYDRWEYD